ncbi:hypothetical protein CONPUDRAFT_57524 [Coniophora puteana RWD-64-598 SS2]|uniref:FAD-binding domain-containing protein n=1 Tax=Coniophora puteana (strain RWD-64-598) TaxID=741705 RepID=A0A5M3MNT1_CONPW|nr:uncharacterized protein CONPUDRAFT_57524 [Coniophora puteana RWD-64-598 SS2]EIW80670.1 hypothetical protein CONPUDRAFT_57524 [Coniophora puteana RWD-64-598 SS2]
MATSTSTEVLIVRVYSQILCGPLLTPQCNKVGAGPVGHVAALALLRSGLSVRIIEKAGGPQQGQRGSGNWVSGARLAVLQRMLTAACPRTLEVYHFLGAPEINREGTLIPRIQTHVIGSLDVLSEAPMTPHFEPTPDIPFLTPKIIGQNNVARILASHIQKLGCNVEYGTELVSFEQDGDGVVAHVKTSGGDKETSSTIKAQYLIGTDGARGIVRKQLGLTFLGETRDTIRVLTGDIRFKFLIRISHLRPTYERAPSSMCRPWSPTRRRCSPSSEKRLMTRLRSWSSSGSPSSGECRVVRESHCGTNHLERPNIRMVDKFGEGRVFVAGGNVHSPTGGQGLNSGVQDAFNLAWKIALVSKGLAPSSLLDTYTTERLPVIANMLNITTGILDKTFGPNRQSIESAMERGRLLYMLGVNYRTSPIVLDEFAAAAGIAPVPPYTLDRSDELVAGDRAPDAPGLVEGNATVTLFDDVFGPTHHTALVFSPDVQTAVELVRLLEAYAAIARTVVVLPAATSGGASIASARVLVDKEGYAHNHYLVKDEPRVVIVRPDGVVGAIVAGSSGVQKYFGLIQGY